LIEEKGMGKKSVMKSPWLAPLYHSLSAHERLLLLQQPTQEIYDNNTSNSNSNSNSSEINSHLHVDEHPKYYSHNIIWLMFHRPIALGNDNYVILFDMT
jgi:hypothetical protein